MKKIELLSPARDLECGIAAINHGADAVYIGAPRFGARKSAGNSISDIERLAEYAGRFNARVYLTMNTLLFDSEIKEAEKIANQAWNAGVSALIIQDMAFMEMSLPPIRLFASTQTDNRTPDKVLFLEKAGFDRVILARELSPDEIMEIRHRTTIDLEAFVHGAVCYSFSGRCYMSAYIGGRSANRGECGQPCRLGWDLVNDRNEIIIRDRHLLSLKDMGRYGYLGELMDSGVTSFKIEGRLKDADYVKNVTAFYRKTLDEIFEARAGLGKSSSGKTFHFFNPDPERTFSRGIHSFFPWDKDNDSVFSINSPKSMGKKIGTIKKVGHGFIETDSAEKISNGDGLCFMDEKGTLSGFMVEKTEGQRIHFSSDVLGNIKKGMVLYRNRDREFQKILSSDKTSERRIGLDILFSEIPEGFSLFATDEDGVSTGIIFECVKTPAEKPEQAMATIRAQLSKLGDTIFYSKSLEILSVPYFIRVKDLNQMRRDLVCDLEELKKNSIKYEVPKRLSEKRQESENILYPEENLDFSANISNQMAKAFYEKHGVKSFDTAFETSRNQNVSFLMHSRHCVLKDAGLCRRNNSEGRFVIKGRNHSFEIFTDCKRCEMYLRAIKE